MISRIYQIFAINKDLFFMNAGNFSETRRIKHGKI